MASKHTAAKMNGCYDDRRLCGRGVDMNFFDETNLPVACELRNDDSVISMVWRTFITAAVWRQDDDMYK